MRQLAVSAGSERPGARAVAWWLCALAAMVFVMIVLGGVTRLTESGLSIVDWRPVTGWLPPLSDTEWRTLFAAYQGSPEFRHANFWMTLADFKEIYWLEYLHRLWGRVIAVAFAVPFVYFLARGRLKGGLAVHLWTLLALGAAQGLLGWYMVRSGLVDVPTVSQYRLAAHLALAVLIYGYMLWLAFGLFFRERPPPPRADGTVRALAFVALAWAFLTMLSGAFVAGIDAGLAYNTFPLMDGRLLPRGLFALSPWMANLFENTATVQFNHRVLAILLVVYLTGAWLLVRRRGQPAPISRAFACLAMTGGVQACLGIATLLSGVALPLAAAHQVGAIAVLTAALWAVAVTRPAAAPDTAAIAA